MIAAKSTRDAYGEALVALGGLDEKVVVLDADVAKATKSVKFAKAYPGRFFNVGCAEQNLIGTAAGLALTGKIPFASTFAVFAAGRAFDQIRNTVAYAELNVKIVGTHGGITVGADGASHQSIEDIALMRVVPNMTVIVPADAVETRKVIMAVAQTHGPVYIRLGRASAPSVTAEDANYAIGKGVILREGRDIAVIACGIMTAKALEAAGMLAREGIEATVINMHTIKPLDEQIILEAAGETGAVVTAEEHSVIGGLGGAVAECLSSRRPVPLERVGLADTFAESGSPEDLLVKYGLTAAEIVRKARRALARKTDA